MCRRMDRVALVVIAGSSRLIGALCFVGSGGVALCAPPREDACTRGNNSSGYVCFALPLGVAALFSMCEQPCSLSASNFHGRGNSPTAPGPWGLIPTVKTAKNKHGFVSETSNPKWIASSNATPRIIPLSRTSPA